MGLVASARGVLLLAAVALLAGGAWAVLGAFRDRDHLREALAISEARLTAAEAELARQAETARIHRAHLDRAADEAREWRALSIDLQKMEGRDEPLSPFLSATVGRLWGAAQGTD